MSKKQLPKRTVPFKLEKHPTAERLDALRSQGIESIDDLDRIIDQSTAGPSFDHPVVPTSDLDNNRMIVDSDVLSNVVIATDPLVIAVGVPVTSKDGSTAQDHIKQKETETQSAEKPLAETNSSKMVVPMSQELSISKSITDLENSESIIERTNKNEPDHIAENNISNSQSKLLIDSTPFPEIHKMESSDLSIRSTTNSLAETQNKLTNISNKDISTQLLESVNTPSKQDQHLQPISITTAASIITPTAIPKSDDIHTAIIIPIDLSIETTGVLENSHSQSANAVFRLLWFLAKQKNRNTIRVGTKELLTKTEIRSHVTVRKAIDELILKKSISIIEPNQGKIPPVYRLFNEKEILKARKQAGIEIDEDTRFAFIDGIRYWPVIEEKITTVSKQIASIRATTQTIDSDTVIATTSAIDDIKSNLTPKEIMVKARKIEQICKGLKIKVDNEKLLLELIDIPIEHIILGICKKVETQQKSTYSLSDCIKEIEKHFEKMKDLPEDLLAKVAYSNYAETVMKTNHK